MEEEDNVEPKSLLLNGKRFSGRHTGQHIASTFASELRPAGIKDKFEYIITDNAAHMQNAFLTAFPVERSEQPDPESDLLDENQNMEYFLDLNTEIDWILLIFVQKPVFHALHTRCSLYVMD